MRVLELEDGFKEKDQKKKIHLAGHPWVNWCGETLSIVPVLEK
jgi:hypothetical protein